MGCVLSVDVAQILFTIKNDHMKKISLHHPEACIAFFSGVLSIHLNLRILESKDSVEGEATHSKMPISKRKIGGPR